MNQEGSSGYGNLKKYLAKLVEGNKSIFVGGDFNEFKLDIIE
jgi:hypothetical protein